ncbi:MAG TPA: aminotransferase class I/II-fold pyridoxal phosphate-dependent enzyme [Gemmatimonadaceae bacterium]
MTTPVPAEGTSLDSDLETFRDDLRKASDLVVQLYAGLDRARVTPAKSRMEIASLFDEPLPAEPQPIDAILRQVEHDIFANSTLYLTPRFLAYINASGNQASVLAELLASAVNQICAMWHFSPAASEVERRVIQWIGQFIGYAPGAGGCLVSGGSAGNLVGLAVARRRKAPFDAASLGMRGGPPLTVYTSREGHASIEKGMVLLGMGRHQLRRIPVGDDFTIDMEALEQRVTEDRKNGFHPICVVGNAGTTNTGAVDPLDELAEFCRKQDLWLHVDAAYGGPAAATEAAGRFFRGLDRADSVAVNPHKWLYVPAEAGCILVRDPRALRDTFQIVADYLREDGDAEKDGPVDFKDYSPQLHRNFRALKVWMTFKAYGTRKLRAAIESNIEIMRYLADRIDQSEDFVRLAPVPLSTVCFQYRTSDISVHEDQQRLDALNERLPAALEQDGRVFLSGTTIRGRRVLRACSVNHRLRRQDVDLLLDVIREVGDRLIGEA